MSFPETKNKFKELEDKIDEVRAYIKYLINVVIVSFMFMFISNMFAAVSRYEIKQKIDKLKLECVKNAT